MPNHRLPLPLQPQPQPQPHMRTRLQPHLARLGLHVGLTWAAVTLATLAQAAPAAFDDSSLPATLRSGYVGPVVGPADDNAYARGTLGLIRPSYGRASLFVAWRVMHLPPGAVARESHERRGSWLHAGSKPTTGEDEKAGWLEERATLQPQAPAVQPDYFRLQRQALPGAFEFDATVGQCGPDAFAFATRTLRSLKDDASLTDADRRSWVAGQDAVFARCTWVPGKSAPPPLPAALPGGAPARLKALDAYQRAAALLYGDDYDGARRAFDAIAAKPDHPMRPWAVLGALRSILRNTVRDAEWEAAVDDAWTRRGLRGAAFNAAVAEPAARRNSRVDTALREMDGRAKAAGSDTTLAPVHRAIGYTMRRALLQLAPGVPLRQAMTALDRAEYNPYTMGALDLFQQLYPRIAPDRPAGAVAAALRQHSWFDFVVTVQACADGPTAQDAAACEREHAHAYTRWQETQDSAWLLATLMTAGQPSAADSQAAEAARTVADNRPEWASLQFYAARVLRQQGRGSDARSLLDALANHPAIHQRDRGLVEAQRKVL